MLYRTIATMSEINIDNRASTRLIFYLNKNIDGAKFYYVILNYVN